MTESVELNELVLNDDDRQFEHLLSVELSAPLVIQWKHLTFGSKTQILSLVLPFLRQLYQFVIRDRVFHMRRNQVPKGKIKSIIPTKYNLSQRLAGIEDLLIGQYNAIQKIKICALYYSMLPEDSGPDLFLLDVISHSVKLNRLVTNQELLDLAKQSIEEKRNVRLLNYSHEQYKASGKQELASRKIKWNQDETIQELAKRYREGNIYRLITNCFETHQTIK
ncbi:hypothetical protein [Pseudidiomarina woesei]|uniref:Uncharacterized protein n=1 Tax=Pseudidiomarina woesei TaxID=1381080 RepID=A0A0K6HAC2_9GAMM|nr:hypothetical protein [Pseudidiomarina woesei]CUA87841.1 hypothetical protein Ga0061064_1958 [Pseudidiomarina woesei]